MSGSAGPAAGRAGAAAAQGAEGPTIEEHLRSLAPQILDVLEAVFARREELEVAAKAGRFDLVTDADRSIEAWLHETVRRAFPRDGFLGEETGRHLGAGGTEWIVDPIDGTVNLVNGFPWSCCSIGVAVDGAPAAGLIVDPHRHEVYLTAPTLAGSELGGAPMAVAPGADLAGRLVLLEVPSGIGPSRLRRVEEVVGDGDGAVRTIGSGALALAMVAAGRAQAVVHLGPSVWDVAAGVALVLGAGGAVVGREGPYVLGEPGPLVAGSPEVCELLQPILGACERAARTEDALSGRP